MTPQHSRLSRRTLAALWGLGVTLVALYSILVPIQAVLYGASVPVAFLFGAGVCAAPALVIRYPRSGIAVFAISAFALPLTVSPTRDQF